MKQFEKSHACFPTSSRQADSAAVVGYCIFVLLLQAVQMQRSSHSSAREEKKTIAVSVLGLCSASVHLFEMASRT